MGRLNGTLVDVIQQVERVSQAQALLRGYTDRGHSLYAAYDTDDLSGLMFHGSYTNHDELPSTVSRMNGCGVMEMAEVLYEEGILSVEDYSSLLEFKDEL